LFKDFPSMRLTNPTLPLCNLATQIETDLAQRRGTGLKKPHIPAIADVIAAMIATKSVNTCLLKHALPRQHCNDHAREKFIHRLLKNPRINPNTVMASYGQELLALLCQNGETAIVMLDQSKLVDGVECLMLSIRVGERALPWLWEVIETGGAIGFDVQERLLNTVLKHCPADLPVVLMGDRFYGTAALIGWCQQAGWGYRLRLRRNLELVHEAGLLVSGQLLDQGLGFIEGVELGGVCTNIGVVQDAGYDDAWIIAMDCVPNRARVLDYGLRWGIESLFSDMKSRGFDVCSSHLRQVDRLSRLLLLVSIGLYWCVSLGADAQGSGVVEKKEDFVLGLPRGYGF
jgi:hypothetical protein